jgi:hypothetical protein
VLSDDLNTPAAIASLHQADDWRWPAGWAFWASQVQLNRRGGVDRCHRRPSRRVPPAAKLQGIRSHP